ncbi:unnamed protein product [Enterobius vermicularis]|uniref:Hexosyltransferase n=1 Tax=Enterobius vermicularis TaxID=51028 RepID=A0A0N4UWE5_ENTVE|nr:unnamed protein product [Enterobius vermicularis]
MTAAKYVDSRAYNVWRTWAQHIPGKVFFFVAENTETEHPELPIIRLRGVDDAYPPQKKSFAMLKWMADNHLNDFDWFMRADDDLYVRGDRLEQLLRSLDSDKAQLIGQAGLGSVAEYGQLALGEKDNYCMGGPGVVMSRETLRSVAPHLRSCLMEMLTTHEDVELGRCIRKHVGVACTWNYEMQTLFHNNQSVPNAYDGKSINELRHSITLHPIKHGSTMRKIHVNNRILRLAALRSRQVVLLNSLPQSPPPSLTRRVANTTSDLMHWDYIASNSILFCSRDVNCPRHTVDLSVRTAVSEVITQLFDEFNQNARQRGRTLQFQNIQYGYTRVEPRFGVDYVLDMILWFKKFRPPHRATLSVRRHAYVQQTFGPIMAATDNHVRFLLRQRTEKIRKQATLKKNVDYQWSREVLTPENPHVHLILPLAGRADIFKRFSRNLKTLCPDNKSFSLIVVLFNSNEYNEDVANNETIHDMSSKVNVQVVRMGNLTFSRGLGLAKGAALLKPDALIFFTDVDMLFTCDTLDRIRLNTIRGAQIYFPVVFSEYSPDTWSKREKENSIPFEYGRRKGYFRHFGFGLVSLYKSDLDAVGGINVTIKGWGLEDVDLFEKCVRSSLRILRIPDPSLVHVFHQIRCPKTMPDAQYKMCVGSKAASLASLDYLAEQAFKLS